MSLFDDDIDFNVTDKNLTAKVIRREAKKKFNILKRGDELAKVLPNIEQGFDYHLISSDNFGSLELLMHVCKMFQIEDIYVTTWSYNNSFVNFIEEQLTKSKISICVDQSIGGRKHSLFNQLKTLAVDNKINFKQHFGLHSKVTILKGNGIYISLEASANYSENKRIEQFNISTSKELYDFHYSWIKDIF